MPMNPEEINGSRIPRGLRGYDVEQTDDLLRRIEWDYRIALNDRRKLAEELEQLRQQPGSAAPAAQSPATGESQKPAQAIQPEFVVQAALHAASAVVVQAKVHLEQALVQARSELHEATAGATSLQAQAQIEADSLVARARAEAENLLAHARVRLAELEGESERARADSHTELERLADLKADVRFQLHSFMTAVLEAAESRLSASPELDEKLPRELVERVRQAVEASDVPQAPPAEPAAPAAEAEAPAAEAAVDAPEAEVVQPAPATAEEAPVAEGATDPPAPEVPAETAPAAPVAEVPAVEAPAPVEAAAEADGVVPAAKPAADQPA